MSIGFLMPPADEFSLPAALIHVVQSFLTSKQAAQTTLLSKSWRTAWLTRPNLVFDQADFRRSNANRSSKVDPKFLEFAEKTLERYENQNLKIQSFSLDMDFRKYSGPADPATLLVRKALKLGPTRLTFDFHSFDFYIPDEVFGYENLISLTAKRCGINPNSNPEVCCSRLRFFSFECVLIERPETFFHILSGCPLIEKLSLCLVGESLFGKSVVVVDGLQTNYLHRLTSLVLKEVDFDTVFLADLSSKFPSLKDLTLSIKNDHEEILISSPTLERLDLNIGGFKVLMRMRAYKVGRVKLDVPSIRKLTFDFLSIPKLSVRSSSRGCESYVSLKRSKCLSPSWFNRLSNLIRKLSFSRISLSLDVYSRKTFHYEGGEIRGSPRPEIENLDIYQRHLPSLSCYALFDGLFRICHPKAITQYMRMCYHEEKSDIRFLGKRLLDALDAKFPTPANQLMYGLNDLKEARIQVFDEDFKEWSDEEPLDALSYHCYFSTTLQEDHHQEYRQHNVRFRLYWKQ